MFPNPFRPGRTALLGLQSGVFTLSAVVASADLIKSWVVDKVTAVVAVHEASV